MRWIFGLASHALVLVAGFGLGVYTLPILTAAQAPKAADYEAINASQPLKGVFRRDLKGSDFFHWGEGEVMVSPSHIAHRGKLAPGPDYKLYLVPDFVEDEASFLALKAKSARIADITGYSGFVVPVPQRVDINQYTTVVIWCESFKEFISAAKYR
jgi:Electron transfer DM13